MLFSANRVNLPRRIIAFTLVLNSKDFVLLIDLNPLKTKNFVLNQDTRSLNDTVAFKLHLIPKVSSSIPDKQNDVSTMRHVSNLNLADHIFNVPHVVYLLLGADDIEDILLDNKMNNGLCIRDSAFSLVVSGPV